MQHEHEHRATQVSRNDSNARFRGLAGSRTAFALGAAAVFGAAGWSAPNVAERLVPSLGPQVESIAPARSCVADVESSAKAAPQACVPNAAQPVHITAPVMVISARPEPTAVPVEAHDVMYTVALLEFEASHTDQELEHPVQIAENR